MTDTKQDTTRAATDVPALLADLDAGVFERVKDDIRTYIGNYAKASK